MKIEHWTPRTHTRDLLSANDLQAYTSPPPASRLTRLRKWWKSHAYHADRYIYPGHHDAQGFVDALGTAWPHEPKKWAAPLIRIWQRIAAILKRIRP